MSVALTVSLVLATTTRQGGRYLVTMVAARPLSDVTTISVAVMCRDARLNTCTAARPWHKPCTVAHIFLQTAAMTITGMQLHVLHHGAGVLLSASRHRTGAPTSGVVSSVKPTAMEAAEDRMHSSVVMATS